MADRAVRYGIIVLDPAPAVLRARGTPVFFASPEETIEYARMHDIIRWMVFGDPDGWWPIYTQAGPVSPAPEPKRRVDISLRRYWWVSKTYPADCANNPIRIIDARGVRSFTIPPANNNRQTVFDSRGKQ